MKIVFVGLTVNLNDTRASTEWPIQSNLCKESFLNYGQSTNFLKSPNVAGNFYTVQPKKDKLSIAPNLGRELSSTTHLKPSKSTQVDVYRVE